MILYIILVLSLLGVAGWMFFILKSLDEYENNALALEDKVFSKRNDENEHLE